MKNNFKKYCLISVAFYVISLILMGGAILFFLLVGGEPVEKLSFIEGLFNSFKFLGISIFFGAFGIGAYLIANHFDRKADKMIKKKK